MRVAGVVTKENTILIATSQWLKMLTVHCPTFLLTNSGRYQLAMCINTGDLSLAREHGGKLKFPNLENSWNQDIDASICQNLDNDLAILLSCLIL